MPAQRAHWNGYLKLSLVSCPIALYPAISAAEKISFRQVNRQTGNRLRHQLVDTVTGEAVEARDKGRGYEVGENRFLMVDDHELAAARDAPRAAPTAPSEVRDEVRDGSSRSALGPRHAIPTPLQIEPEPEPELQPMLPPRPENTRTIEIERFVPRAQIDPQYFDKPYFIVPRDEIGAEAFAVIRDAMRGKDMMALGHITLSSRERPIALEARGRGLRGVTLRSLHEIRDEADYFADIPDITLPKEMLKIAEHILDTKAGDFDPAFLTDHYREAVVRMLKDKQAELPQRARPTPTPENVVNLMDVLKRSMAAEKKAAPKTAGKRQAKRDDELRKSPQFKLSIAGGKKTAAQVRRPSSRRKSA